MIERILIALAERFLAWAYGVIKLKVSQGRKKKARKKLNEKKLGKLKAAESKQDRIKAAQELMRGL